MNLRLTDMKPAQNPEPRCPCILLVDKSNSMNRKGRISNLNQGLESLGEQLRQDRLASIRAEIAVVTYNQEAELTVDFTPAYDFHPKAIEASGNTNALAAVHMGLEQLERRKREYEQNGLNHFRPMMFLITDGEIYQREHRENPAVVAVRERLLQEHHARRLAFFAVGVEPDADMESLSHLSPTTPKPMREAAFMEFFAWLSQSMANVSHSEPGDTDRVILPETKEWSY